MIDALGRIGGPGALPALAGELRRSKLRRLETVLTGIVSLSCKDPVEGEKTLASILRFPDHEIRPKLIETLKKPRWLPRPGSECEVWHLVLVEDWDRLRSISSLAIPLHKTEEYPSIFGSEEKYQRKVRAIGEQLLRNGGIKRMRRICELVYRLGGDGGLIDAYWNRIGEWRH